MQNKLTRHVDLLRNHTTSNITSIQTGMIPEVLDIVWSLSKYYLEDSKRKRVYKDNEFIIKVVGLRYHSKSKKDISFNEPMYSLTEKWTGNKKSYIRDDALSKRLINPFMLFVNNRFIKWSNIRIVRSNKYSYLIVKDDMENLERKNIYDVQIVNIPFSVKYTESGDLIPSDRIPNLTELFRFNDEGELHLYGLTSIYACFDDRTKLIYRKFKYLIGAKVSNVPMDINKNFKLSKNNFFIFKNGLFTTVPEDQAQVKNLNLLSLQYGMPLEKDTNIIFIYRDVVNTNKSNITIPPNETFLRETIIENSRPQIDITAFGRDFDYRYDRKKQYDENVTNALNYINRYNKAFFDEMYLDANRVYTRRYTKEEIVTNIKDNKLTMPRAYHEYMDTYVMIFLNGEIWDLYYRIKYETNNFSISLSNEELLKYFGLTKNGTIVDEFDGNEWEFVYFAGCNNNFLTVDVTPDNNEIRNTTIPFDDLMVMANYTEDHIYPMLPFNKRTVYPTDYKIDRPNNTISFTNSNYYGKTIYMASTKQFHHVHYKPQHPDCMFYLPPEFIPAINPDRYMIFVNGRLLSDDMYRILVQDKENTITRVCIHIRKLVDKGDSVDIFYLPYNMKQSTIADNSKVSIVKTIAYIDKQPMFTIPFPVKGFNRDKNSFFVIRGSVIVDPARYNVVGDKLIFLDKEDYVDYHRELTFVFLYSDRMANIKHQYIPIDNILTVDATYTACEEDNQFIFKIPYPEYVVANGIESDVEFFITYRGLHVNPRRYKIERGDVIFHLRNNGFKEGMALVFVFIYMNKDNDVDIISEPVPATRDNQLVFDIPVPYDDYLKEENTFFVNRNGVFLNKEDYIIDKSDNTLTLNSPFGLDRGQELVMTFITGKEYSIKTGFEEIKVEEDHQIAFDLPETFKGLSHRMSKFFVTLEDTFVDPRRYEIVENQLHFLQQENLEVGRKIRFMFAYLEPIGSISATIGTNIDASKFSSFESIAVKCTKDNQREFVIPWKEHLLYKKNFFITIGSTFVDSTRYTMDVLKNTITLDDDVEMDESREVLFTLIDSKYAIIEKKVSESVAVVNNQMDFDIPLPFDNYFELGNRCLVFNNSTYMDENLYTIDTAEKKININDFENSFQKGQKIKFLFMYIASKENRSFESEEVQHPRLPDTGYLHIPANQIGHSLNPKLFFMFVNGKKVTEDNIIYIANNIIRLKSDIFTRFNTVIIDYTPVIPELEPYREINSDYDIIMNKASNDDINTMWNNYNRVTDMEFHLVPDISQEAIINDIIKEHFISNGVNEGNPFIYTYDTSTLKHYSIGGKRLIHDVYDGASSNLTVPDGCNRFDITTKQGNSGAVSIRDALLGYVYTSTNKILEIDPGTPSKANTDVFSLYETIPTISYYFGCNFAIVPECIYSNDINEVNSHVHESKKYYIKNDAGAKIFNGTRKLGYSDTVAKNIAVTPGVIYKIKVPKGGAVNISYKNEIYEKYVNPKYKYDIKSNYRGTIVEASYTTNPEDDNAVYTTVTHMKDGGRVGDRVPLNDFPNDPNVYDSLESWLNTRLTEEENMMHLSYTDPGEYFFLVPYGVRNLYVSACSGYEEEKSLLTEKEIITSKMSIVRCIGMIPNINKYYTTYGDKFNKKTNLRYNINFNTKMVVWFEDPNSYIGFPCPVVETVPLSTFLTNKGYDYRKNDHYYNNTSLDNDGRIIYNDGFELDEKFKLNDTRKANKVITFPVGFDGYSVSDCKNALDYTSKYYNRTKSMQIRRKYSNDGVKVVTYADTTNPIFEYSMRVVPGKVYKTDFSTGGSYTPSNDIHANGAMIITYEKIVESKESSLYISNVLEADKYTNPRLVYDDINSAIPEHQLDPSGATAKDEFKLDPKDMPKAKDPLPKPVLPTEDDNIDDYEQINFI